jgi:hypothetical protein
MTVLYNPPLYAVMSEDMVRPFDSKGRLLTVNMRRYKRPKINCKMYYYLSSER